MGESTPAAPARLVRAAGADPTARPELCQALDTLLDAAPAGQIAIACDLPTAAAWVLALLVLAETDENVQAEIEELLGHPGARRPTYALLTRLLGDEALGALAPGGPLDRAELIESTPGAAFSDTEVHLPGRVVWACLGDLSLDPALPAAARVVRGLPGIFGDASLALVHGPDRTRRLQTAISVTRGAAFLVTTAPATDLDWRALVRQAGLLGVAVVLELDGDLDAPGRRHLERAMHLAWAISSADPQHVSALPDRPWQEHAASPAPADDVEILEILGPIGLGGRRLTADQLRLASVAAANLGNAEAALRRLSAGPLDSLLSRTTPRVGWNDLVLPSTQTRRLRALADRYRNRGTIHQQWGLAQYPSPGLVALFAGPSGTGKTLSAEVIAQELGVDLLRVDLQAVVSKYIGETEKQLEQVFETASAGDSVLLFDEADSLFGSRSKVSDARDRYANLEVSYLLQRLETYPGFVVLTTNFAGNIDQAFTRRVHASIHFQLPSAPEREQIWRRSLANAPLDNVDLAWAAQAFDLSGGSIRNAALATAFLAAADGEVVRTEHLVGGLVEELVKLGRRPSEDLFGRYWSLVDA